MARKDAPPRRISDERLPKLSGHDLERAKRRHLAYADRLEEQDPGRGLPGAKAQEARARQLEAIEVQVREAERLEAAADAWYRSPERNPSILEKLRGFHHGVINAAHNTPEDREFMRQSAEALRAQEEERAAKRQVRELSEKRKAGPPDPRASSIAAAVLADPAILDGMRHKLRPAAGGGQTAARTLDFEHVGVLAAVLLQLEERGSVLVTDFATSARFFDPELPRISNLGSILGTLRPHSGGAAARATSGPSVLIVRLLEDGHHAPGSPRSRGRGVGHLRELPECNEARTGRRGGPVVLASAVWSPAERPKRGRACRRPRTSTRAR